MFIQTEETPNPNSVKFLFDSPIAISAPVEYTKNTHSGNFASDIFETHGVEGVYITNNFLTITKADSEPWSVIKPQILHILSEYLIQKKPLISDDSAVENAEAKPNYDNLSAVEKEIVELIEERVRPAVAMDGGDIQFIKYESDSGIVYLRMHGACSGCPSSSSTLQGGVKRMLQHYIPEITDVIGV